MKIRQINLGDDELPETIVVEMSLSEAIFVGKLVGNTNDPEAETVKPGGKDDAYEVYSALTGGVFNRFWDGGVEDL